MFTRYLFPATLLILLLAATASAYPPAGDDNEIMTVSAELLIYEFGPSCDVLLTGPTIVHRSDQYDPGDSKDQVDTEILSMNLSGSCSNTGPILVTPNPSPSAPSIGSIKQQTAGQDFPADAFFDVFYVIDLPDFGMHLQATLPSPVQTEILELPLAAAFFPPAPQTIQLIDPDNPLTPVGELTVLQVDFTPATESIINSVTFSQIDWFGNNTPRFENSSWGQALFDVNDPATDIAYINVVALDNDGFDKWVVKNLPILPLPGGTEVRKVNFRFSELGYADGEPVGLMTAQIFVTSTMYSDTPPVSTLTTYPIADLVYDYEGRPGGPHSSLEGGIIDPLYWTLLFPLHFLRRTNIPNVEAGNNECGPAAAANSFSWLADEYDYAGVPEVDTLLDSLRNSRHMRTNIDVDGTNDDDFLAGKMKLVNEYDLPIEVHFQGGIGLGDSSYTTDDGTAEFQGTRPTFEWIEQQLDMGQDVELGITWFDSLGMPDGGHWICLEGKIDYGLGGPRGVYYRHDTEQDSTGGTEGGHFSWLGMNSDSLLVLINEPSNQIDFAVAESPTDESFLPGDADGNGIVNIADAVFLISYIFGGGAPPEPITLGDADANGIVNIADAVYLISFIFGGGPAPGACGEGSTRLGPFCVTNTTGANKTGVIVTLAGTGGSLSKPIVTVMPAGCSGVTVSANLNMVSISFDDACIPPNGRICFTVCSEHRPLQLAGAAWH